MGKGLQLLIIAIMAIKAIKMETEQEMDKEGEIDLPDEYDYEGGLPQIDSISVENSKENNKDKLKAVSIEYSKENNAEDKSDDDAEKGRLLKEIILYTTDDRCAEIGVCSGFDYGDGGEVVTFQRKPEIRFTSDTTYKVKDAKDYLTLTFVNSKFTNFPLNLFYAFMVQELDMRNCSIEEMKWDNFLKGEKLTILLLSENLITEIKPMLFSYVENLSFLFLDSNRIDTLYNDSFKGLEKLNYLDLHHNFIETLPSEIFSYLPSLQQINLGDNLLKVVEHVVFSDNPNLFSIHLERNALNEIQEYAFQNQKYLRYLDISNNPDLEVLVSSNIKVEHLWIKNCSLNRVNIYGEAVHVDFQQNHITELYFSKPEYLETLCLKDNSLEQISSLARTKNLRTLDLSNNPLLKTLPDLWQINSLERLDLSNTSLKDIPITAVASPHLLRSLNVSSNRLEEINPLNFKYLEKLSQFYIHNNNWNCYNLQMLMDMVIKPLKMSYTRDEFDDSYPGEYIQGIKCMYRLEQSDEYFADNSQQIDNSAQYDYSSSSADSSSSSSAQQDNFAEYMNSNQQDSSADNSNILQYNQLKFDNAKEVEKLRREFKAVIGIYEQKFSIVLKKINDLDIRLKQFEQFNQTMWQQVSIMV